MSSTGGELTIADSPPSISRLSCRSTWPIRRFSAMLGFEAPAADRRQDGVQHGPQLLHLVAGRGPLEVRADTQQLVEETRGLGALDPAEQRRLKRRAQAMRQFVETPANVGAACGSRC